MIIDWEHENSEPKVGSPFIYSDQAILCLLSLREVFKLTYRQTEGFGRSLVKLMQIEVRIPDYTSLQKRAAKLQVALDVKPIVGARDIVIDSTGLKGLVTANGKPESMASANAAVGESFTSRLPPKPARSLLRN